MSNVYNQQLTFNFEDKRLIKEVNIKYYEYLDSDGTRKVKKETNERKWFDDGKKHHNPTCSYHSEVI